MNSVNLIGRLVRDPEVRYTSGTQMAVARFTLAVDRPFKREGEQTADFFSIVAFGKSAELAKKYLAQGRQIGIEGRLQSGSYTNKEGNKVYTTDVVVDRFTFTQWAERKDESNASETAGEIPSDVMNYGTGPDDFPEGFQSIDDSEIPY